MHGSRRLACFWPDLALIAISLNLVVFIAAPLVRPDLDLFRQALSYYAIGPWGRLQATAFVALGVGSFALSIALLQSDAHTRWMRIAETLLVIGGLGSIGLVVYPMGKPAPSTILGDAHQTAGTIGGVAQLAAVLAFALGVRADPAWRRILPVIVTAFLASVLGAVLTQVAIWQPERGIPMGAVMRLAAVPLLVLWGAVAFCLRQQCWRSASQSAAAR